MKTRFIPLNVTCKNAETEWPSNGGLPILVRGAGILQTELAPIMHHRLCNMDHGFTRATFTEIDAYVKNDQESRDRAPLIHL